MYLREDQVMTVLRRITFVLMSTGLRGAFPPAFLRLSLLSDEVAALVLKQDIEGGE